MDEEQGAIYIDKKETHQVICLSTVFWRIKRGGGVDRSNTRILQGLLTVWERLNPG